MWFVFMILLQRWNDILREANIFNTSQMGKKYHYHINITKYFSHFFRAFVTDDILKVIFFKKRSLFILVKNFIFSF